jgi:tetratricopeptide (TPR) repeat protein
MRADAPQHRVTRGCQLELLIARKRWAEARRLADELVRAFPASSRIHLLAGRIAFGERDYERARRCFRESARLHDHPLSRAWLARASTNLGRFDEAEPLLQELAAQRSYHLKDLAWLHERRGHHDLAREAVSRYLGDHPDDGQAREQQLRLRAASLAAEQVIEEVDTLDALGEEVPDALIPRYLESLLQCGRHDDARAFVEQRRPRLPPRVATNAAWTLYRGQVHDVACALFLDRWTDQRRNVKYLFALEKSADRAGRIADVVRLYEAYAAEQPDLNARLRRLRARLPP